MARWTTTHADMVHMAAISQQIPLGGIAVLKLKNGDVLEGIMRRINVGNNAGQGGWQFHGECEIETLEKQRWVVDYLDIESAHEGAHSLLPVYVAQGLITIRE